MAKEKTPLSAEVDRLIHLWMQQARDQAFVVMDPQGVIVGWLGAAAALLGHTAEEAMGRHIGLIFTSEDQAKGYAEYELKVAAEDRFSEDSRWHVRKDGTRIWVSGTVTALRDPDGTILGYIKVLRDLTDERSHTERFVNQLSEMDLARSNTHTFLSTLGHELRNPLAVLANVEMILQRVVADERGRKATQQLSGQLAVLRKIADDLMDVSRLEQGKLDLELAPADLREILQE
ncbi:MAG TPA: PAS domain S-box protein, partial [Ramlibacter sp.]|nr:PAS domain S-box protein [Ramlibacter sp.]